jgi:hypothetical protein
LGSGETSMSNPHNHGGRYSPACRSNLLKIKSYLFVRSAIERRSYVS